MDRVSLEAAVSTANLNLKESAGRLDGVVGEINELQGQLRGLREQLEVAQKNTVGVQVRVCCLFVCLVWCVLLCDFLMTFVEER